MVFDKDYVDFILEQIFPLNYENFFSDKCFGTLQKKIAEIDKNIKLEKGLTKCVIIPPGASFVIKMPFKGTIFGKSVSLFSGANAEDRSDYCLAEYNKYLSLKDVSLEKFVAKTYYYKTIDGIRIFIQEKIIPLDNNNTSQHYFNSKDSFNLAEKTLDEYGIYDIDTEWMGACFEVYGYDKVIEFIEFCTYTDTDLIEDMHEGNYGYRENGEPALLDFSGYFN